jgi:hypothetical protein
MSKVSLAGNASGTGIFTIASPNSNTDRTLTLPNQTGTLLTNASTTGFPAGSVLQVVSATQTYVTTSSASLVDTGLTATITPSSTSNKILVLVNLVGINPAFSGSGNWAFVLTDGSNTTIQNLNNYNAAAGTATLQSSSYSLLLSPSTTSAITYKVRYSVSTATLRLGDYSANLYPSTITLMEIAA